VSAVYALIRGNFYIFSISLIGLLVELLVILLAVVPFAGGFTFKLWNVSTLGSATILIFLAITLGGIAYGRRGETLPRLPYSIPAIATYLHATRMLSDFDEMARGRLGSRERDRRLKDSRKTYGFGWTVGTDGVTRAGVDEEELKFDYPYGAPNNINE